MNIIIGLVIIILLYLTPLNSILYNSIYNCIGNIISGSVVGTVFSSISFLTYNIQSKVTWILYFTIVVLAPVIIAKSIKEIWNLVDNESYTEIDSRYREYLYKYSRGTKEINNILILGIGVILSILALLRCSDVRVYALGFLLIRYVLRAYNKETKEIKVAVKEDKRYKKVKSITKNISGAEYKTLKWKYVIDHCNIELPIEFQAKVRINDGSVLTLPNRSSIEVTVSDLAKEIENACKIKDLSYKNKIHAVLSLLSQFKYEVLNSVEDDIESIAENDEIEERESHIKNDEVSKELEVDEDKKLYELKTPRNVIETESGNGIELGKCAVAIFRAMLIDVEEVDLPRKDGENKVALFIEGADIEKSDNYYIKYDKKYYYCEILKDNKYFIGEKPDNIQM